MTSAPSNPPQSAVDPLHRWKLMVFVALAQLMVVLDVTIVNIALPSAQADLHFADDQRQWIVTAYALAFGSLLLLGGRIGDIVGRKWTLVGGLAGFAIASALGGAATSFAVLVTARALQGTFGALLAPAVLSTLVTTFTDPRERGRAFGIFGTVAVSGSALGLVLGGLLTGSLSWRWCLYVNLFFAVVSGAGVWRYMHNVRPPLRPRIDLAGTAMASAGLFLIVFGFSRAESDRWAAPLTIGSLALGGILLGAFLGWQTRSPHPLLPLRVIRDRTRGPAYMSVSLGTLSAFALFLFLTYYMQRVLEFSPIQSGLAFLPFTGAAVVTSNISAMIVLPRYGPRFLISGGMVVAAGGLVLLSRLSPASDFVNGILPGLILLGLGSGCVLAPSMNTATVGVTPGDSGVASALVNTMQQVGGSIGTSITSTVAAAATAGYLASHPGRTAAAATHGYTTAFLVAAGVLLAGAVVNVSLLPSRSQPDRRTVVPARPAQDVGV